MFARRGLAHGGSGSTEKECSLRWGGSLVFTIGGGDYGVGCSPRRVPWLTKGGGS